MLEVYAHAYIEIGREIQSISQNLEVGLAPEEQLSEDETGRLRSKISGITKDLEAIDLKVSGRLLSRLYLGYRDHRPTFQQARADILNAYGIMKIELETRLFFFVPTTRAAYYSSEPCGDPEFFGEFSGLAKDLEPFKPAIHAFPSIDEDLREAGNCYAFGRYSATVYFLMRVMESGLKAIGKAMGVAYGTDWGRCIAEMEKKEASADLFFKEAITYLRSVKNVWRNPTMHADARHTEQQAKRIFDAVQGFMQHLATKLTE